MVLSREVAKLLRLHCFMFGLHAHCVPNNRKVIIIVCCAWLFFVHSDRVFDLTLFLDRSILKAFANLRTHDDGHSQLRVGRSMIGILAGLDYIVPCSHKIGVHACPIKYATIDKSSLGCVLLLARDYKC